jgi:hypothetical protein
MVVRAADYQLIAGQLYKLGLDNILRRCVLNHERQDILWECHNGVAGGHVGGKATAQKVLQAGLWWATLFKDAKEYARSCDTCQRVGKPSHRDELPLQPVRALQAFEKWVVDFIGPINPQLSIQRPDTSLPQQITSQDGMKQRQFKIVRQIQLLDLSLKMSLLGLDVLEV